MQDHICQATKGQTVQLSAQEILDCSKGTRGCKGGSVNQVLSWGKRKGFVQERCYPTKDSQDETCPEGHLIENDCRLEENVYKVIDFCLA